MKGESERQQERGRKETSGHGQKERLDKVTLGVGVDTVVTSVVVG